MFIKNEILNLLEVSISQNYFEFNNSTYTSEESFIIDNPLNLVIYLFILYIDLFIYLLVQICGTCFVDK